MHIAVVIPTYNEAENLPGLLHELFSLPLQLSVLIVDDHSPDGTGDLAEALALANAGRIQVLHRPGKLGIASAYLQGFHHVLQQGADAIAQMDADFSHDAAVLVSMSKWLDSCDVVMGSRYTRGGSVDARWPFWRRGLSAGGNFYARSILSLPLKDVTTGYRLWKSETLRGMPLDRVQAQGYIFQVEMAYLAYCLGYRIRELPIHFAERQKGTSKMSLQIQVEAAWRIWQILLAYRDLSRAHRTAGIGMH